MTRFFAILGAVFCIGMIFPMVATEHVRGESDPQMAVAHLVSEFILVMSLFLYCGFAALHSVSHVQDPNDRMGWIVLTVVFNVLGSLIYYLTKYQDFRSHGMGGLVGPRRSDRSFYRASPSELDAAAAGRDPDEAAAFAKIIQKRMAKAALAFVVVIAVICYFLSRAL